MPTPTRPGTCSGSGGLASQNGNALTMGNLTGASYPHTGLTSGTKYFYLIRAVDADGRESESRQIEFLFSPTVSGTQTPTPTPTPTLSSAHTPTPTPTATPTEYPLPAPVLTAKAGPGQVTLTWEAVSNADSYFLIYYDWAISDWRQIGGVLTGTSYTHRGLTVGKTHYYLIHAVGANGAQSEWSGARVSDRDRSPGQSGRGSG